MEISIRLFAQNASGSSCVQRNSHTSDNSAVTVVFSGIL